METVTNIVFKEDHISNLFIAGLLNSKFLDGIFIDSSITKL